MADTPEKPSPSGPRKRILVVDDDLEISKLLIRSLVRAGFSAEGINHPLEAAETALKLRPDLVILDFDMPTLTGPEVAIRLKQTPELAHVPIVFLSGMTDADHRAIAGFSGSVAYLSKPVEEKELIRTIQSLL